MDYADLFIGCAGWSVPSANAGRFAQEGSHLQRYARVFNAVEINSSFYRNHLPRTYRRWAGEVPDAFRFSVKFPRSISHDAKLHRCGDLVSTFLAGASELGERLGCLLLQLPPGLVWDPHVALAFFDQLRRLYVGPVACEPRHASWFHRDASRVLAARKISRVAADPALSRRARVPAGDRSVEYVRLHGTPRMYYDSYQADTLQQLAARLQGASAQTTQRWCIFDNTASGQAMNNALSLLTNLSAD